jgi:flagellar assembly protein FliH
MNVDNSPRILKADSIRGLGSKIVFNYSDMHRQCEEYLEQARREGQRISDEAKRESEGIRRSAHEEGRTAGLREGLAHAADDIEKKSAQLADAMALEKLQTTFPALQAASEAMVHERDCWLSRWETTAVGLAIAIAEKILHRELEIQPEIAVELVRETLDLAAGSSRLLLRMHPKDVTLLGPHADDVVRAASRCGEVEIAADPSIARGGCVIETQHGTIDARLETQLERIMSELVEKNS